MGCADNEGGRELIEAWGELANVQMWELVNGLCGQFTRSKKSFSQITLSIIIDPIPDLLIQFGGLRHRIKNFRILVSKT